MTSVNLYQGLGDGERNSSRVLNPPGGASSNIFGGGEPEPVKVKDYYASDIFNQRDGNQNSPQAKSSAPVGAAAAPFASEVATAPVQEKAAPKAAAPASNPLAPPPAEPAQQGGGRQRGGAVNPITGEIVGQPSQNTHTSTRVRQPPGGASSGLW